MALFPNNAAADAAFFGPYPYDFSLLVKKKDLAKAKCEEQGPPFVPFYWPPVDWESIELPRDDSAEAIRQWFDFVLHPVGPLACLKIFGRDKGGPVDCGRFVRDAWLLVRHFNALGKTSIEVRERPGRYAAHEALIELENIYNQLSASLLSEETGAGSSPAEAQRTEKDEQPSSLLADDREALAIALLYKHPDWSIAEIAEKVGVDRKTLYRWPKFREAATLADKINPRGRRVGKKGQKLGSIRPGHRTEDGRIEAVAPDDQSNKWEDDE